MSTVRRGNLVLPRPMWLRIEALRQRGGWYQLMASERRAGEQLRPGACPNCGGDGIMVLQTIMGGPYEQLPLVPTGANGAPRQTPTVINGKWHLVDNRGWRCPVCDGTGLRA